jgi:hypothetical protein
LAHVDANTERQLISKENFHSAIVSARMRDNAGIAVYHLL